MVFPPQRSGMFGSTNLFQNSGNFPVPSHGTGNGLTSMLKGLFGSGKTGISQAASSMPFSTMANTGAGGTGGLAGSLQNIQQILKMVESTTPVIKQYGPMVKNLPAMFKMMKALNNIESSDTESDTEKNEESTKESSQQNENNISEEYQVESENGNKESADLPVEKKRKGNGESVPLLYI